MPNCKLPLCCKGKPVLSSLPPVDILVSGFHGAAAVLVMF